MLSGASAFVRRGALFMTHSMTYAWRLSCVAVNGIGNFEFWILNFEFEFRLSTTSLWRIVRRIYSMHIFPHTCLRLLIHYFWFYVYRDVEQWLSSTMADAGQKSWLQWRTWGVGLAACLPLGADKNCLQNVSEYTKWHISKFLKFSGVNIPKPHSLGVLHRTPGGEGRQGEG